MRSAGYFIIFIGLFCQAALGSRTVRGEFHNKGVNAHPADLIRVIELLDEPTRVHFESHPLASSIHGGGPSGVFYEHFPSAFDHADGVGFRVKQLNHEFDLYESKLMRGLELYGRGSSFEDSGLLEVVHSWQSISLKRDRVLSKIQRHLAESHFFDLEPQIQEAILSEVSEFQFIIQLRHKLIVDRVSATRLKTVKPEHLVVGKNLPGAPVFIEGGSYTVTRYKEIPEPFHRIRFSDGYEVDVSVDNIVLKRSSKWAKALSDNEISFQARRKLARDPMFQFVLEGYGGRAARTAFLEAHEVPVKALKRPFRIQFEWVVDAPIELSRGKAALGVFVLGLGASAWWGYREWRDGREREDLEFQPEVTRPIEDD